MFQKCKFYCHQQYHSNENTKFAKPELVKTAKEIGNTFKQIWNKGFQLAFNKLSIIVGKVCNRFHISLTFPLIALNLMTHSPELGLFGILSSK